MLGIKKKKRGHAGLEMKFLSQRKQKKKKKKKLPKNF